MVKQHFIAYNDQRPVESRDCACHAPERSLYIGLRGNVWSCCFNKTHVLGKYPDQSLNEIWQGSQRKEISDAMDNFDFSKGCHGCEALIQAGDYNNLPAKNFDELKSSSLGYPTKVDFELSNECNLECVMCRGEFSSAIRKNRERLPSIPSPYDQSFIEQLKPFIPHIEHSHFLGGEPFMIPIYLDIWEIMTHLNPNIRISVQTNATILSPRVKAILESMRFDIAISIDSFSKQTYEHIRKNASFEKVMDNINWFRNYCLRKGTNLTISYCPMTVNWQEIPEVIERCNAWETRLFFNTVYYPKELSFISMNSERLTEVIDHLKALDHHDKHIEYNYEVEQWNHQCLAGLIAQLVQWRNAAKTSAQSKASEQDFESFNLIIKQKLREKLSLEGDSIERIVADCMDKIEFILLQAEQHGLRESAEHKLMEVELDDYLKSLPNTPKEHLLYLFKSFILPIPD